MLAKAGLTLILAVLLLGAVPRAPDVESTYSNPTNITNPYAPFLPGKVNIFRGRSEGARTNALVTHLEQTRVFDYGGGQVECRILEEQEFEKGELVEIAVNFLAQDDAGNVRYFGEISWLYEDGAVVGIEEDSWLVGGPTQVDDPPGAHVATEPTMYMPADPQLGETFVHDTTAGHNETFTVVAIDVAVSVPAGKFANAIKLRELDDGEDGPGAGPAYRWLVPGVGIVKDKDNSSRSDLIATSLIEEELGS